MLDRAKELQDRIVQWRRTLHTMPEIGLELDNTAAYVRGVLDELGIPYETYVNGHGMVATIGNDPSNIVAIRADMDGLPIREETGLEFASTNGCMHACGHDSHTAMLLGAGALLKEREAELPGMVKLIFQPGEETMQGAKAMLEDGIFDAFKPKAMLAMHIEPKPQWETGQVLISRGTMMASSDAVTIRIYGKAGHASLPQLCADPVTAAAHVITAIQTMVTREFSPLENVLVGLSSIHSKTSENGEYTTANNAIPGYVQIDGTIRTLSEEARAKVHRRTCEVAEGICATLGVKCECEVRKGAPVLVNDEGCTETFLKTCHKLFDDSEIVFSGSPIMGSEDASFFMEQVPGVYFQLISNVYRDGVLYPAHSSGFYLDESVFHRGSALLAQGAIDLLDAV